MEDAPRDATIDEMEQVRPGDQRVTAGPDAATTMPSELAPADQDAPPTDYDDAVDDTFPASDPPAGTVTT